MRASTDWATYLAEFHAAKPGITEDVLSRCSSKGRTPYDWLTETVRSSERILDLACGSGPARPSGAQHWVGLDRSEAELRRARSDGRQTVLRGDATSLPVPDATFDVVTYSMGLMLVQPLDRALGEVSRALLPDGRLLLLLPAGRPLHVTDRTTYLRLFWAARSTTKFPPTELGRHATEALAAQGLQVTSDDRRRFVYPMPEPADGDRFVDSWYLPGISSRRRASARARARAMTPRSIGVPFRRVIARKMR